MKTMRMIFAAVLALALTPTLPAQEKSTAKSVSETGAPQEAYRVQVVLSEYDGANKIASLPYTVPVVPGVDGRAFGSMRTGIRVAVPVGSKENSLSYLEVGTNLDVRVKRADADRYALELTAERSWLYIRVRNKDGNVEGRAWAPGDPAPESAPMIHTFRGNVQLLLRDGRPGEGTAATDPITGHVFKVEAVLTVLK
jgi:hypothetical protein